MPQLVLTGLAGIPEVRAGDSLSAIILAALDRNGCVLCANDVLVVAQKIVSKAEGRQVRLDTVQPSPEALALARDADKDPRLMELVLRESRELMRVKRGVVLRQSPSPRVRKARGAMVALRVSRGP